MNSRFHYLHHLQPSQETVRWAVGLCVATMLEAVIFSILFFLQNSSDINTPKQQQWLQSYHVSSLEEFIVRRYMFFEAVRRLPWTLTGLVIVMLIRRFPIVANSNNSRGIDCNNVGWHTFAIAIITVLHGVVVQNTLSLLFPTETFPMFAYFRAFNGLFLSVLHYIFIVIIATMIHFQRKYRMEELRSAQLETELAQAQLEALKMQLHPHFLFNALNSISSLLYKHPRRADMMISRLGNFLRMTLDNPTTQFIALSQEIDLLKCYVDIEMMRFPKRLHVEIQIEDGLQDAEIPNLLLQPLVENSIKYGILQSVQGGTIWIHARRLPSSASRLEITVRDNGPGIKPDENPPHKASEGIWHKKSSIGLHNTRSRLEKLYGTNARFDTYNAPEGGFVVYIEIPLHVSNHQTSEAETVPVERTGTTTG